MATSLVDSVLRDPASNSRRPTNDLLSQVIIDLEHDPNTIEASRNGFSNPLPQNEFNSQKRRRGAANLALPTNVEIIDVDSLAEKTFVKTEDGNCVFIKSEPIGDPIAKGFIKWPNTKDNPIVLDDDERPEPEPEHKDSEKNSPHLEDVPRLDREVQDDPLAGHSMALPQSAGISALNSNHALSLSEILGAHPKDSSTNLNLGSSSLKMPRGPPQNGRLMTSEMRNRLRKIQQKAFARSNQPASVGGGASSIPRAPAISSAPAVPVTPPPEADPSAQPAFELMEEEVSFEDLVAEHERMDAQSQHTIEREFPDDYLDAVQKFQDENREYEMRRDAGEADIAEDILFMQEQAKMDSWRKIMMENRQFDNPPEPNSLFVEGDLDDAGFHGTPAFYRDRRSDQDNFYANTRQLLQSDLHAEPNGGLNNPSAKKEKEREKRGKGKFKKPAKQNTNNKVKDRNAKVSKKDAKSKRNDARKQGPDLFDYGSLFTGNVIRDAQQNEGRAQLPNMNSTRRNDALKALVASVPQEHRKTAQVDRSHLDAACREFVGRMSVRASSGNDGWDVTGMTCVLKHHQLLGTLLHSRSFLTVSE
jgi:hypothetical protein